MANRRMFSKSITNSARFLRMPPTSRLLYFDLGMQADDDGIVEAFTVMRMTGAAVDDLRVLASKKFIVILNEDLVTYITDWSENNYIRSDRYQKSVYSELLVRIDGGLASDYQLDTVGIPECNQWDTQIRLGKNKDSISKKYSVHFEEFWRVYPRKKEKLKAYNAYKARLKDGFSEDELLQAARGYATECQRECKQEKYIKLGATFLSASTPFVDYLTDHEKGGVMNEQSSSSVQLWD